MKTGYRLFAALLLFSVALISFSSCFAGAGNTSAPEGERDGVYYLFLRERGLLILSSERALGKSDHVFSLDFAHEVRELYLGGAIVSLPSGALGRFTALEKVCFRAESENVDLPEDALPSSGVAVRCGEKDLENSRDDGGRRLGHCLNGKYGGCLLCGAHYVYVYKNLYACVQLDGELKTGFTDDFEGETRTFDAGGKLQCEGFTTLGGYTRYFKENRMITGSNDIDGYRCVFNTNGEMTSKKALDKRLPFALLIPAIAALPVGALAAFGVCKLYKKRSAKEEK